MSFRTGIPGSHYHFIFCFFRILAGYLLSAASLLYAVHDRAPGGNRIHYLSIVPLLQRLTADRKHHHAGDLLAYANGVGFQHHAGNGSENPGVQSDLLHRGRIQERTGSQGILLGKLADGHLLLGNRHSFPSAWQKSLSENETPFC